MSGRLPERGAGLDDDGKQEAGSTSVGPRLFAPLTVAMQATIRRQACLLYPLAYVTAHLH